MGWDYQIPRLGSPFVVLDARIFYNPESSSCWGCHVGSHPGIIKGIMRGTNNKSEELFRPWLAAVKHYIRSAQSIAHDRKYTTTDILVYCRSGKHRSVAVSHILSCLLMNEGLSVTIEHLSKHLWHQGVTCGQGCTACHNGDYFHTPSLFEIAQKAWNEA